MLMDWTRWSCQLCILSRYTSSYLNENEIIVVAPRRSLNRFSAATQKGCATLNRTLITPGGCLLSPCCRERKAESIHGWIESGDRMWGLWNNSEPAVTLINNLERPNHQGNKKGIKGGVIRWPWSLSTRLSCFGTLRRGWMTGSRRWRLSWC